MTSPALLSWINTTILIENDWGETGTGFLVSRLVDNERAQAFLITNKHVLNRDSKLREQAQEVFIHVNMRETDNTVVGKSAVLPLHFTDSTKKWREHPDRDIDVLAINVTSLITNFPQLEKRLADYDAFANQTKLKELEIGIGDDVIVIGYPVGIKQGQTNYPVVRSGMIATRIGELFEDEIEENGSKRKRTIRGFLIDGATVPGSSGSPVILKPTIGRYVNGSIQSTVAPALLLGVICETFYAPVKTSNWDIPSFAGLGLVLDAETVRKTIELFYD